MKSCGYLAKYIDPEGKEQKVKALNIDQKPEFLNFNRVFVRLLNDDFSEKMLEGKKVVGLKHKKDLKFIGFID